MFVCSDMCSLVCDLLCVMSSIFVEKVESFCVGESARERERETERVRGVRDCVSE